MPKLAQPLTEVQISKAKAKAAPFTLADGNGLYLAVSVAGLKAWIVRYRLPDGRNQHRPPLVTIPPYRSLMLVCGPCRGSSMRCQARKDHACVRKTQRAAAIASDAKTTAEATAQAETERASFHAVSGRWLTEKRPVWSAETYRKARLVVDSNLVPTLGDTDMRALEARDVRPTLVSMTACTPALAKNTRQYVAGMVEHAINDCLRSDESTLRLNHILPTGRSGHMPSVTEDEAKLG